MSLETLESENFALDIAGVLQLSGWTVKQVGSAMFVGGPTPVGMRVTVQDPQTPGIPALLSAFKNIGIALPVKFNPKAQPPTQLIVGNKP